MYSRRDVIKIEVTNNKIRLFLKGVRKSIISTAPIPYMGQIGPFKNPLFTKVPVFTAA